MNELIEDYQRKINTINELLKDSSNSEETINRLKIKVGCYRSFLTDLNRALNIDLVSKTFICGNCLISEDKCECKKALDFGMVEEYYDDKRKCWATRLVKD